MKTLNCLHKADWMCEGCCMCGECCRCGGDGQGNPELVHINSKAAVEAWRRTIGKEQIVVTQAGRDELSS